MSGSDKTKVYILYDYEEGKLTDTQQSTRKLVENLCKRYNGKCNIKRYWEDFMPGKSRFDEHEKFLKWSNIIVAIITRESMSTKMFNFEKETSLLYSIKTDTRFVPIGVGIQKEELRLQIETKRFRLYKSFSKVDVDNDDFLNNIFLPQTAGDQGDCSLLPERPTVEGAECSLLPQNSTEKETDTSSTKDEENTSIIRSDENDTRDLNAEELARGEGNRNSWYRRFGRWAWEYFISNGGGKRVFKQTRRIVLLFVKYFAPHPFPDFVNDILNEND